MAYKNQVVGIVIDRSVSMRGLESEVLNDYNSLIETIENASKKNGIDTTMFVMDSSHSDKFGLDNSFIEIATNSSNVKKRHVINMNGNGTNINDGVVQTVNAITAIYGDTREVLIYVLTDGQDNRSSMNNRTFQPWVLEKAKNGVVITFRGPQSVKRELNLIDPENFLIWNNRQELVQSTAQTAAATTMYFDDRAKGVARSTLYSNLHVSASQVKAHMQEVTKEIQVVSVWCDQDVQDFVNIELGVPLLKGSVFYQLTKTERNVQSYKQILIRDKKTGKVYAGDWARQALGLPLNEDVTLKPGMHGQYDIFVQSTSNNRKLIKGTDMIWWPSIGQTFSTDNSKVVVKVPTPIDPLDKLIEGKTCYEWYRDGVATGRRYGFGSWKDGKSDAVKFFNEGVYDGAKHCKLRYKR